MFFNFENEVLLFEHHTQRDVECFVGIGKLWVVGVFDKASLIFLVEFRIDMSFDKIFIQIVQQEELSGHVYHGAELAFFGNECQSRYTCLLGNKGVIGTKSRCNVYDTRTVFCGYIVARNYTESSFTRIHPWNELLVFQSYQVGTLAFGNHLIRNELVTWFIVLQCHFRSFRIEQVSNQRFGQYVSGFLAGIGIEGNHSHIVNLWSHAESCIGR